MAIPILLSRVCRLLGMAILGVALGLPISSPVGALTLSALSPHAAVHSHLYVAGWIYGTPGVYRFPIIDGLPATTPDQVLLGNGFSFPMSVAFDGAGYEYVSDYYKGIVTVYAPGATGNAQPVRTIPVQDLSWMAVNKAGYLFAVDINGVEIYAPGVGSPLLPPPKPLHRLGGFPLTWFGDIVVDGNGRLYAQGQWGPGIYIYNDPVRRWEVPDGFVKTEGGIRRHVDASA